MKKKITTLLLLALSMTIQAASPDEMVYDQVSQYVGEPEAGIIAQDICDACYDYNLDPILAAAVFTAESYFDNGAISPAGAIGIAQLMPKTAADLKVDPYNERSNIYGGVAYLAAQVDEFGDYALAEAAYNAGPGAVEEAGGIPNYAETIDYVNKVERIRQEIWDRFGNDTGYYENEDTQTVHTADEGTNEKAKEKRIKNTTVMESIRVWPPIPTQH